MAYLPRIVDDELATLLRSTGAVLVEGPKGSGKTETARRASRSEIRLDVDAAARTAAEIAPQTILRGERPRLIDEWQLVPNIWDHVRRQVDADPGSPGQFILTGSAVPADDATRHTGAMRFTCMRMRTMTLFESGHSNGEASLAAILAGERPSGPDPGITIEGLVERISLGGWPGLLTRSSADALPAIRGYLDEIRRVDVGRLDGIRRDPEGLARVIRALARNVATGVSARTLAADVAGADQAIKHQTVLDYIDVLARLMIVENQPAWAPGLRSRARLRAAAKRHFVDPSLAVASLRSTPARLLRDIEYLGFLFESLVVRDLRVYAQAIDGRVLHYRDSDDLEIDAIVELGDGRWAAVEATLGQNRIEEGAASLLKLRKRVDPDVSGEPAALVVVTGWGYAYHRDDGVSVIPIGMLGP